MGRRIASREIITIELAEDFWIKVRKQWTYGEKKALRKQFIRYEPSGPVVIEDDVEDTATKLIAQEIVEWNVEDGDGKALPVTAENINALTDDDSKLIINALAKLRKEMDEETKKA